MTLQRTVCMLVLAFIAHQKSVAAADECPSGWLQFKQSCYLFSRDHASWFDAAHRCRELRSHLVTIDDENENSFLVSYMTSPQLLRYFGIPAKRINTKFWPYGNDGNYSITWIGYNDLYREGSFLWVDTDSTSTFVNWDKNQPDNALGSQHCAHLWVAGTPYGMSPPSNPFKWNDMQCDLLGTFVCEMSM